MTRSRLWTIGVSALMVTALALPAVAGQRGDGPRGPRGRHFGFHRILTQEQMEQIRPLVKAEREASQPLIDLHKQLREAVLAETPDQGKIASLQSQIGPLQAEALTRRTALAQRIAGLLTPEQRTQIRESRMVPPFLDPLGPGAGPFGPGGPGAPGWRDGRGPRHAPDTRPGAPK